MVKCSKIFLALITVWSCSKEFSQIQDNEPPMDYKGAHQSLIEDAKTSEIETTSDLLLDVETGLDVLVKNNFDILRGKRVGVITNQTGLTKDGHHIVDLLQKADKVDLTAIFGPEHGIRGVEPGGLQVKSILDSITGVPIYSLYGRFRKPTDEMFQNIDVLVFDIQDVGARFYTYIYTMALAMETAALHGKMFIVLDRPNPITGIKVGGPLLHEGFESFVGMFEMPVRHGMTIGELALLFKGEGWIKETASLNLKIVQMTGWERRAWLDQTNVPWVRPSPSMKTLATATVYPGTCFMEGTNVSEGRGTDKPFEKIGAPWIDDIMLANELNKLGLKGVVFQPTEFTPVAMLPSVPRPKFKDELCKGVFIRVVSREKFKPEITGVSIVWTIKHLYPKKFRWRKSLDRLYGSDKLRKRVEANWQIDDIVRDYDEEINQFKTLRAKYILYK